MFRVKKIRLLVIMSLLLFLSFYSCREKFTPRPMGYLRFKFPEHNYLRVSYPYISFEKPEYMVYTPKESPENELWFNLTYPHYGVEIHCSYKPVKENIKQLSEDVHYFVYKHTIKSTGIDESVIMYPENSVFGIVYRIRGNVASNIQFVATDSISHFLRGALYLHSRPNEDSLAPIIDFAKQDIDHMLKTLQWN